MNNPLIKQIKDLYQQGKSAKKVADVLGIKENKVRYWMRKGKIRARSWSEATYCKRNPEGNPFNIIEQIENHKDLELFFVSIGLYLGEGTKKGKHKVALGNTNPDILNTFLIFLKRVCNVNENKITAELNIFDDIPTNKAINYWSKKLGLPKKQIKYVSIRKSKGGTYKNKSKYGTLTIVVNNSKLKKIILEWCHQTLIDCIVPVQLRGRAFAW